jgi:hypothetical protein
MHLRPLLVYKLFRYQAIFLIQPEGMGRIEIFQITEYKDVELLHLDMQTLSEDEMR